MVIKSISHTGGGKKSDFRRLLAYICDLEKTDGQKVLCKQFVGGYDLEKHVDEFHRNDLGRKYKYGGPSKKRVIMYHEVMSFNPLDAPHITRDTLLQFAKEYMKLRAPESLVVATAHFDGQPHIHFAISGCTITGQSARISRSQFTKVKLAMTEFQKTHFPELIHSLPDHSKKKVQGSTVSVKNSCDLMAKKAKKKS